MRKIDLSKDSFMKLKKLLEEELRPQDKWLQINPDKYPDELITLVKKAYQKAPMGSFIKSRADLGGSDWKAINLSKDENINATVFYREARSNEPFRNKKIRGIGHDGSSEAINTVLGKLKEMLSSGEYWVEASDALEHILYKLNVPYVKSEVTARRTFPGRKLTFIKRKQDEGDKYSGRYTRMEGGRKITETIFGKPKF